MYITHALLPITPIELQELHLILPAHARPLDLAQLRDERRAHLRERVLRLHAREVLARHERRRAGGLGGRQQADGQRVRDDARGDLEDVCEGVQVVGRDGVAQTGGPRRWGVIPKNDRI